MGALQGGGNDVTSEHRQMMYLTGIPIPISGKIKIYSVPLKEIWEFGYERYISIISAICIQKDELKSLFPDIESDDLSPIDFIIANIIYNKKDSKSFYDVIKMLTHEKIDCDIEKRMIRIGDGTLSQSNIGEFQEIVKDRNLMNVEESHENPSNDKARQILERSRELRRKRKQYDDDDSGITFADIISIMAAKMEKSISEIGDYDIWQINDQLARLKAFDDYEVGYQALLHGAKKEDVDLNHWIGKNINLFE